MIRARRNIVVTGVERSTISHRPSSRTCAHGIRRGFTLIEVVLAMVLATAILAALWSALSIHMKSFERGRTTTQQAQLARAILQRIARDLRSVPAGFPAPAVEFSAPTPVPDPAAVPMDPMAPASLGLPQSGPKPPPAPMPTPAPMTGSSPATGASPMSSTNPMGATPMPMSPMGNAAPMPTTGAPGIQPPVATGESLFTGYSDRVTLVVQGIQNPGQARPAATDPMSLESGLGSGLGNDEGAASDLGLMRVQYALAPPEEGTDYAVEGAARGLVRIEHPWEPAVASTQNEMSRGTELNLALAEGRDPAESDGMDIDWSVEDPPILADEVIELSFRYFDGHTWNFEWDSSLQSGLPRAIEINLVLEKPQRERLASSAAKSAPPSSFTEEPLGLRYRLVVALPQSGQAATSLEGESALPMSPADSPNTMPPAASSPMTSGGMLP